jgi:hypothetical protein
MGIGVIGTDVGQFAENFSMGEEEMIAQNINALAQAGGMFRVVDQRFKGQYVYNNVRRRYAAGVSRRDPTSTSGATDIPVQATSDTRVKLKRTWGPFANTKDAWYEMISDAGGSVEALAQEKGREAAEDQVQDWLNTGLRACRAALVTDATNEHDITGASTTTLNSGALIDGAAKFGDAFMSRIVGWIGHSTAFFNLMKDQTVTLKTTGISDVSLAEGTVRTLGKPFIVTDSPSLVVTTGTGTAQVTKYHTLALVAGAIHLDNSRPLDVAIDQITGLNNLVVRLQGEYDFNVGLKGFQWDTTNGGANPTDANVGLGTNWDQTGTSNKDLPGLVITSLG